MTTLKPIILLIISTLLGFSIQAAEPTKRDLCEQSMGAKPFQGWKLSVADSTPQVVVLRPKTRVVENGQKGYAKTVVIKLSNSQSGEIIEFELGPKTNLPYGVETGQIEALASEENLSLSDHDMIFAFHDGEKIVSEFSGLIYLHNKLRLWTTNTGKVVLLLNWQKIPSTVGSVSGQMRYFVYDFIAKEFYEYSEPWNFRPPRSFIPIPGSNNPLFQPKPEM